MFAWFFYQCQHKGSWETPAQFYTTGSMSGKDTRQSVPPRFFHPPLRSIRVRVCSIPQSCPTLCNSIDCSPPGSSVLGILQARILEWIDIIFTRGSSQPRDPTCVSCDSCFDRWSHNHLARESTTPSIVMIISSWSRHFQEIAYPKCKCSLKLF